MSLSILKVLVVFLFSQFIPPVYTESRHAESIPEMPGVDVRQIIEILDKAEIDYGQVSEEDKAEFANNNAKLIAEVGHSMKEFPKNKDDFFLTMVLMKAVMISELNEQDALRIYLKSIVSPEMEKMLDLYEQFRNSLMYVGANQKTRDELVNYTKQAKYTFDILVERWGHYRRQLNAKSYFLKSWSDFLSMIENGEAFVKEYEKGENVDKKILEAMKESVVATRMIVKEVEKTTTKFHHFMNTFAEKTRRMLGAGIRQWPHLQEDFDSNDLTEEEKRVKDEWLDLISQKNVESNQEIRRFLTQVNMNRNSTGLGLGDSDGDDGSENMRSERVEL